MSEFYFVSEKKPDAFVDVLAYFDAVGFDVVNYDPEEDTWAQPNHGFAICDCEPKFWWPLPEIPDGRN